MPSLPREIPVCKLPPELTSLNALRGFVTVQAQHAGLAEEECALLTVAVAEVFTNIVRHARGIQAGAEVLLSSHFAAKTLALQVQYAGEAFAPPEQSEDTDFAAFQEGGFGLTIIQKVCDQVEYLHHQGINTVRLHRALPAPLEPQS